MWWPLISPPEEYAEEAAFAAALLSSASIPGATCWSWAAARGHNTVDYMTSEADLRQAVETAFVYCRPGEIAVFVPDRTAEAFEATSDHGGNDDADGRGVHVVHEIHPLGLFSRDVWLRLLADAGFEPHAVTEQTTEDRTPRELFVGRRPRDEDATA